MADSSANPETVIRAAQKAVQRAEAAIAASRQFLDALPAVLRRVEENNLHIQKQLNQQIDQIRQGLQEAEARLARAVE